MKIKYYLVLLLVFYCQFSNANGVENKVIWFSSYEEKVNDPVIPQLPNLHECDDNNDGIAFFNLNTQTPIILVSQSTAASNYSVSYHITATDAVTGANPISNTSSYINLSNPQTIYARVQNNSTSQFEVGNFQLIAYPTITPIFIPLTSLCQNSLPPILPSTSTNGIVGSWSPSILDTSTVGTQIITFSPYLGQCANVVTMLVTTIPNITLVGIGYTIVNNSGIQTLTVDTNISGNYIYTLDGGLAQNSPIFQNISLGNHVITITDLDGCGSLTIDNIVVNLTSTPPPIGSSQQSFGSGATLANMQVTGQNIQWYSGANKNAVSLPLPLNTLLVDGTTYFASQKIGGYESTTRLPVTAQIVLANAEFELSGLVFAPNPVSNILKIKSDEVINEVSVYNFLGQIVLNKKIVGSEIEIDLTSLNAANYFVKVQSENKNSNFKIAKY